MSEAATQGFDRPEFERAMAVLEDEQRAMQLSPKQRLSLRLYSLFVSGFVVFLVAMIAYLFRKSGLGIDKELSEHENIVVGLLAIGGGIFLVCAVVSLVINIGLIVKIIRGRIRFRRMGFSDDSEDLWKAHQKTRRWGAFVEKIALGLGILLFALGLLMVFFDRGVGLMFIGISFVFLMFYVLQNGKARLDMMSARLADLASLKASMLNIAKDAGESETGRIALPNDVIQKFSRVETEQIARSRAQAITDSLKTTIREFSILSSAQVRQAKSGLAPEERLKVEAALDKLMQEPRPAAAEKDPSTGSLRLQVDGTGLELVYDVDDSSMALRVVSLQPSAVGRRAAHA